MDNDNKHAWKIVCELLYIIGCITLIAPTIVSVITILGSSIGWFLLSKNDHKRV